MPKSNGGIRRDKGRISIVAKRALAEWIDSVATQRKRELTWGRIALEKEDFGRSIQGMYLSRAHRDC
jgi:hypothetical protein